MPVVYDAIENKLKQNTNIQDRYVYWAYSFRKYI